MCEAVYGRHYRIHTVNSVEIGSHTAGTPRSPAKNKVVDVVCAVRGDPTASLCTVDGSSTGTVVGTVNAVCYAFAARAGRWCMVAQRVEGRARRRTRSPVGVILYVDWLSGSHFTLSVHCTVDAKYCIPTGTRRMRYNSVRLNATGRTGTVAMMEPQFSSL